MIYPFNLTLNHLLTFISSSILEIRSTQSFMLLFPLSISFRF
jgi:hypothetical protein